jgi:hypothetical protein
LTSRLLYKKDKQSVYEFTTVHKTDTATVRYSIHFWCADCSEYETDILPKFVAGFELIE